MRRNLFTIQQLKRGIALGLLGYTVYWVYQRYLKKTKSPDTVHNHDKMAYVPVKKDELKTFQALKTQSVTERLKPSYGLAMIRVLAEVKDFSCYHSAKQPLHLTDVGGGAGEMLPYFLSLAAQIMVNIIDPNVSYCQKYVERVDNNNQTTRGEVIMKKMEDIPSFPRADVTLLSHSLYYNVALWNKPQGKVTDHLLTPLLDSLKPQGVLCAILQSSADTGQPGQQQTLANLESLEELVYPMISAARDGERISNRQRTTFANAELFVEALSHYAKQRQQQQYAPITWKTSEPVLCTIHLGDVNFIADDKMGKYQQSDEVLSLFNFYTRGQYLKFSAHEQKQFLDFIRNNCQTPDGQYVITHVNKIIVVMRKQHVSPLIQEEESVNQINTSCII